MGRGFLSIFTVSAGTMALMESCMARWGRRGTFFIYCSSRSKELKPSAEHEEINFGLMDPAHAGRPARVTYLTFYGSEPVGVDVSRRHLPISSDDERFCDGMHETANLELDFQVIFAHSLASMKIRGAG